MIKITVQKNVVDQITGEELLYTYTAKAETQEAALQQVCIYASMVEFGYELERWKPKELPFAREQLYQFIQPQTLSNLEAMNPNVVDMAYNNALAYVQSYVGAMFDIHEMMLSDDTTSTGLTLRLALCISTATFILAAAPHYSEVIDQQRQQLHYLIKGLKSGQRNFGKNAIANTPNVRVSVVSLKATGTKP